MSDVTKGASGRCLDCGGSGSGFKRLLEIKIDAMRLTICESCAEDLRDNLIEAVGAPEE